MHACGACRQSFGTRKDLHRHRKVHLEPFVTCPHCEKRIQGARKDNLMRHIRTIHKEEHDMKKNKETQDYQQS